MIRPSVKSCPREYAQCSSRHKRIHQTLYVLVLTLLSMPDVLVKGEMLACMQIILYLYPSGFGTLSCIINLGFEPRPAPIVCAMKLTVVAPSLRPRLVLSSHPVKYLP
jgi:hypothetical protein